MTRGGARPLCIGLGVSKFCRVINANFAESLQPLINISFPKTVGEQGAEAGLPIVIRSILSNLFVNILFYSPYLNPCFSHWVSIFCHLPAGWGCYTQHPPLAPVLALAEQINIQYMRLSELGDCLWGSHGGLKHYCTYSIQFNYSMKYSRRGFFNA